jgi:hypothetical protein
MSSINGQTPERRRVSGKTALGRAFNYALSRWEALSCWAGSSRDSRLKGLPPVTAAYRIL